VSAFSLGAVDNYMAILLCIVVINKQTNLSFQGLEPSNRLLGLPGAINQNVDLFELRRFGNR